ncbi:MAG: DMT family transporter [Boseongicola sp.]
MNTTRISNRTWIELVLLGLLWGGSFLAVRIALDEIGVFASVAHRVLWAALALWVLVFIQGIRVPGSPRIWGALLIMGLLNNVIPFSLLSWGQLYIETGLTAILNAATAIWGVLIAAMVFRDERLTLPRLIGVTLGFIGVATAIGLHNLQSFDLRSLAQIAVIGATISYALAGSWARATLSGVSPILSAAGMLTTSAIVVVPLAWVVEGPLTLALEPRTWGAIAYFSLAATAAAYLLYYRILAQAGAGNLLLVTLLVAPVAIILGVLFRGEELTVGAYAGFALLALGLLILDGRLGHFLRKSPAP